MGKILKNFEGDDNVNFKYLKTKLVIVLSICTALVFSTTASVLAASDQTPCATDSQMPVTDSQAQVFDISKLNIDALANQNNINPDHLRAAIENYQNTPIFSEIKVNDGIQASSFATPIKTGNQQIGLTTTNTSVYSMFEPNPPKDIYENATSLTSSEKQTLKEIVYSNNEVKYQVIYRNELWQRREYSAKWQGKYGRWSNIPELMSFAIHRLQVVQPTASIYYDFIHLTGIDDVSTKWENKVVTKPDDVMVVVMQAKVTAIKANGRDIVIICEPNRTGLDVINLKRNNLPQLKAGETFIYHLMTSDGEEIDFNKEWQ